MQTSSARNVAMMPPQCPTTEAPGPYFQKEFFHNGYIKSLKQLVHFYNTRDVYPFNVTSGHCPAGTTEKVDCWPMAEVKNNEDMTVGKLGLTRYGGEPNRCLPPNAHGRLHNTVSRHQHVYRHVHDVQPRHRSKLFTVEARKRLPYPDTASAAVCIGDMRCGASPRP